MIVDKTAMEAALTHLIAQARDGREGVGLLSQPLAAPVGRTSSLHMNVTALRWSALDNVSEYPRLRYEVDPAELLTVYDALEADGFRPVVQVHSHLSGGAAPSPTDVRYATNPALLHMVVDLGGTRPVPVLWRIDATAGTWDKVRFQVADLRKQEYPPTDLTHGVTSA